ncbi:MAG: DNA polymerase III subunit gamma/tau [Rickettsiales bacterium]|nr:DNA polymerase III subunit gamma/tau [Rickettsiales bacterium]
MEYRVLARKYRPTNFDDLIGQDVLVQTLSNAIKTGRIAHAFLLTGIRGVGKTTTARIIARALNCIGPDGQGGATIAPCGVCPNCKMIAEDRHVDILEMDAASHTGVGDIRELIDTVRYLPTSARYKIYIIDEVHMLSGSAFNALLKTLEEPPPHVKFIFATTEARKIPVTILSRCQRFDLKRIGLEMLAAHLARITEKEGITAEDEALKLIAVAAEGSVRDALSLLDQAIARTLEIDGKTLVTTAAVRTMIGSADKSATFRLLEKLLNSDTPAALEEIQAQYTAGSDPLLMVQDALETTHLITRVKVSPAALEDVSLSESDRTQAKTFAEKLTMPVLTRLWQMLLKGITEVKLAPQPLSALEMLAVRVAYAAQLPTPAEAIKQGVAAPPQATYAPTPAQTGAFAPASEKKISPVD